MNGEAFAKIAALALPSRLQRHCEKSKTMLLCVAAIAIALCATPSRAENTRVAQSNGSDGPECYARRLDGIYRTFFTPGNDDYPYTMLWRYIHQGSCQCEGKAPPDCREIGDSG
jgi:hypothetical protein